MFGRNQRGRADKKVIDDIGQHGDDIDRYADDIAVVSSIGSLTTAVLKKSGWSEKDAESAIVNVAVTYASHILLAELRHAGKLPEGELDIHAHFAAHDELRSRLGIKPPASRMSEEQLQGLSDILDPSIRFPLPPRQ
ncbi:MAG: hypothetical protein JWO35_487 [Candidatus Saccharibacteria bacterium]|nr:hypothetical protein [Candidatus Saccharibacteria bacterium]